MAMRYSRREFLAHTLAATASLAMTARATGSNPAPSKGRPNVIIIFTDDQGYNDVGCYDAPFINTPRLDQMADEGMRFTDFYVAAPVCTPSRASLLTGCYPQRVSIAATPDPDGGTDHVLFPESRCGLHPDEITIADLLKKQGYATACVGKWHLGHLEPFLPTRQGFDSYFGIPYSNDMKPAPLMRDEEVIEDPVDQSTLTDRYTEEAVQFIDAHHDEPFFLYLAHSMPHTPLHVPERFRGRSEGGLYGDVIEHVDWSTGEILDALVRNGIEDNTLVVFTSDNGPWLIRGEHGGLATPLRAGKGTSYEGGMRVPCLMRWPGVIPEGSVCSEMATTMDLLPTIATLAGTQAPQDRIIDGKDIFPLMTAEPGATTPHEAFYYYFGNALHAVRSGRWKLRLENTLRHENIYQRYENPGAVIPEALYDLRADPGEQRSVLNDHKDVAKRLHALLDEARQDLGDSRRDVQGKNVRPLGLYEDFA